MIGTLLTHSGAVRKTREELRQIEPPPSTATWKPVGHSELVEALEAEIQRRGLAIREEAYAVQRDGALLFGVIDLAWRETAEFAAAIGLRTANDKSFAIQVAVGVRIFVCDNLVFAGDVIALKRRHTSRLDLPQEMTRALDRYEAGIAHLEGDIARLKETSISDTEAKETIFDVFAKGILPVRFFRPVSDAYFLKREGIPADVRPRTLWSLHNVCTWHIRQMPPAAAFQATTRLGKLFRLGHTNGNPA